DSILRYNAGRERERLALKYERLRQSPFSFLRGTCHLFYERLAQDERLVASPAAWLCGDLHLENFGSYKGDNRLVYFDINDFDEACLGPLALDLVRLLASLRVFGATLRLQRETIERLCEDLLAAHADALGNGRARWIERDNALGVIGRSIAALGRRRR